MYMYMYMYIHKERIIFHVSILYSLSSDANI